MIVLLDVKVLVVPKYHDDFNSFFPFFSTTFLTSAPKLRLTVILFTVRVEELKQSLDSLNSNADKAADRLGNIVDSYITTDYPAVAIEAEKEAEEELRLIPQPKELSEAMKEYSAGHPDMEKEEFLEEFNQWYEEQWRLYEQQTVQREIRTKGR